MEWLLLFFISILGGAVVILLWFFIKQNVLNQRRKEIDIIRKEINEELQSFKNSMQKDMNILNENTTQHLFRMQNNVSEQLHVGLNNTSKAFAVMMEKMGKIDEAQKMMNELSVDVSKLHHILNDKKTRGIYGEIELYTLLESSYGKTSNQYAKQYRLSNGMIVDAVIFGNDALGMIPIDSKFPLENYNRLCDETLSKSERMRCRNEFKNDVKKHIQTIASKYIIPEETSEFAYMFIPAEAIFSYINAELYDIVKYSYEMKVYLVSPTTMMAYITAIKALYLGQKKNDKMKEIQSELVKLSCEFERFAKRYENVFKEYEKTYQSMRELDITAHKIMNRFTKIEAVELDEIE